MKKNILLVIFLAISLTVFSQDMESSGGLGMGIGLSNQTLDGLNYQTIALMPEIDLGFFGIGLNVDLRFTLQIEGDKPEFQIYEDDWVVDDGDWQDYLSLYLSKIAYLRLGHKNEEFYLKAGQFSYATLGNGTILSDYSNMQRLPETRIFGLALDIDGALFNFPYLGFESFIGNVAQMDVVGGRLYTRPLKSLEIPVVSNIEIAASGVIDNDPYLYYTDDPTKTVISDEMVSIYGFDLTIPFIDSPLFSMSIYGDMIFQKEATAKVYGIGGKVISFVNYKLQYIDQEENYVSEYFSAAYDLNRTGKNFEVYHGIASADDTIPAKQDLAATLGFEIPKILYFDAKLTGLLTMYDKHELSADEAPQLYPSLKGSLHIDDEILKIVSADFFYLKNGIDSLDSITSPKNAIIGGMLNYYSGNMVVSFGVDIKYNADAWDDLSTTDVNEKERDQWITNTQISVNFKL